MRCRKRNRQTDIDINRLPEELTVLSQLSKIPVMSGADSGQSWEAGTHSGPLTPLAGTQALEPSSTASKAALDQGSKLAVESGFKPRPL